MSGKALHWAYQQSIKPGPKYLLTAMADVADDDGYLYPSHEYLAHKTGISLRSVVSSMKDLENYGLILRERVVSPDGRRETNAIFLKLENQSLFLSKWEGPVAGTSRKRDRDRLKYEAMQRTQVDAQEAAATEEVVEPATDKTAGQSLSANSALRPGETGFENPTQVQKVSSLSANSAPSSLLKAFNHSFKPSSRAGDDPDTLAENKTVIDDSKSSTENPLQAPASPSQHRGADLAALAHRLTPLIGTQPLDRLQWIIDEAFSTATRTVAHPVAYVVKCVQRDPERYTPSAARRRHSGPTTLLGPGETACTREGHESYPAAHCAACRTDALTEITNQETEPVMSTEELAQWRQKRQNERSNRTKVRKLAGSFGGNI